MIRAPAEISCSVQQLKELEPDLPLNGVMLPLCPRLERALGRERVEFGHAYPSPCPYSAWPKFRLHSLLGPTPAM